jgi:acetylornithine deacetylase/succinyl-diaminopimelate desuccinylase-like protein
MGRVCDRLDEIYAIGGGPGANRVGYTPEEDEAHALAAGWMREHRLELDVDPDGNLVGRLRGADPSLPEVWTGSHLDSVPKGGKFDGALGVVAGLEAVERLGRRRRTLCVVAFRDEERGCVGSRARVAREALPGAFVETHVEQGPVLEREGVPLGVATGIVGYVRGTVEVEGRPSHAGTTPMEGRDDALCRAAELVLAIREAALGIEGAVATVGRLEVEPGGVNVVPGHVTFTIDARAPDSERLDALVAALPVDVELRRADPVELETSVVADALAELGEPVVGLPSGAGHDAGVLARAGVRSSMLFVRSLNGGVSHSPDELSSDEDVELCVNVLARALGMLGDQPAAQ